MNNETIREYKSAVDYYYSSYSYLARYDSSNLMAIHECIPIAYKWKNVSIPGN